MVRLGRCLDATWDFSTLFIHYPLRLKREIAYDLLAVHFLNLIKVFLIRGKQQHPCISLCSFSLYRRYIDCSGGYACFTLTRNVFSYSHATFKESPHESHTGLPLSHCRSLVSTFIDFIWFSLTQLRKSECFDNMKRCQCHLLFKTIAI